MKMFTDSVLPAAGSVPGSIEPLPQRVAAGTPPTITVQPEGDGYDGITAVTLSVTAIGDAPLIYQWYEGESGDTGSPIGGATAATYDAEPDAGTDYWVRVSNAAGSADSETATVTLDPPVITVEPVGGEYDGVTPVTLSVTATGAGLAYQWYMGPSGTKDSEIMGATASTYDASPEEETQYWCEVSNEGGEVNSDDATVTVAPTELQGLDTLQIKSDPDSCLTLTGAAIDAMLDQSGNGRDISYSAGTKAARSTSHQLDGKNSIAPTAALADYRAAAGVTQEDVFPSGNGTIQAIVEVTAYSNFFGAEDQIIGNLDGPTGPFCISVISGPKLRLRVTKGSGRVLDFSVNAGDKNVITMHWDNTIKLKGQLNNDTETQNADGGTFDALTQKVIQMLGDNATTGGHFQGYLWELGCGDGDIGATLIAANKAFWKDGDYPSLPV